MYTKIKGKSLTLPQVPVSRKGRRGSRFILDSMTDEQRAVQVASRRIKELVEVADGFADTFDRAIRAYKAARTEANGDTVFPPGRRAKHLPQKKKLELLIWRTLYLRLGHPLQDIIHHVLSNGLAPRSLKTTKDYFGIGVPFKLLVSQRAFDLALQGFEPVSQDARVRMLIQIRPAAVKNPYESGGDTVADFRRPFQEARDRADDLINTAAAENVVVDIFV